MNTTVQNIDEQTYQALRARAALEGWTTGEVLNEAIRVYLMRVVPNLGMTSLRALQPEPYPEGNEQLSSEIDSVVYRVGW